MRASTRVVPVEWIARGYLAAYARLHETMRGESKEDVFVPLFETLNWLDALLGRPEIKAPSETARELVEALKYARGRVHHRWNEAVELRHDVRHPPVRLGLHVPTLTLVDYVDETVYVDWCWVSTRTLAGRSNRDASREKAYENRLSGQPVRFALGDVYTLATYADIAKR